MPPTYMTHSLTTLPTRQNLKVLAVLHTYVRIVLENTLSKAYQDFQNIQWAGFRLTVESGC